MLAQAPLRRADDSFLPDDSDFEVEAFFKTAKEKTRSPHQHFVFVYLYDKYKDVTVIPPRETKQVARRNKSLQDLFVFLKQNFTFSKRLLGETLHKENDEDDEPVVLRTSGTLRTLLKAITLKHRANTLNRFHNIRAYLKKYPFSTVANEEDPVYLLHLLLVDATLQLPLEPLKDYLMNFLNAFNPFKILFGPGIDKERQIITITNKIVFWLIQTTIGGEFPKYSSNQLYTKVFEVNTVTFKLGTIKRSIYTKRSEKNILLRNEHVQLMPRVHLTNFVKQVEELVVNQDPFQEHFERLINNETNDAIRNSCGAACVYLMLCMGSRLTELLVDRNTNTLYIPLLDFASFANRQTVTEEDVNQIQEFRIVGIAKSRVANNLVEQEFCEERLNQLQILFENNGDALYTNLMLWSQSSIAKSQAYSLIHQKPFIFATSPMHILRARCLVHMYLSRAQLTSGQISKAWITEQGTARQVLLGAIPSFKKKENAHYTNLTLHAFRKMYANESYVQFRPPRMSLNLWITHVLGHVGSGETSINYTI